MKRMVLVLTIAAMTLTACEKKTTTTTPEKSAPAPVKKVEAPKAAAQPAPKAETPATVEQKPAAAVEAVKPETPAAPTGTPVIVLKTSKGEIEIELYPDKAPISVANFLRYVQSGYYNGTIFHRVIPGFMIQGGGMTADMAQKPTKAPIKNEASNGLKNDRGTIAMARTDAPDSATSQFFINVNNNAALNFGGPNGVGYAVFGKVIKGMEVADAIVSVPTKSAGMHRDVPVTPIMIESVTAK